MASKSLTVSQYADHILTRYLEAAYNPRDPLDNLGIATEEVYLLLRKLRDAAGDKSEDAKAPLKAIRDAIDRLCMDRDKGPDCGEVRSLLSIYDSLEAMCEERMGRGPERDAAAQVQEMLAYRLGRVVASDAWDRWPSLKLRTIRLMFGFMLRDNDRLLAASRTFGGDGALPSLKLSRAVSFGRSKSGLNAPPHSKWQDAINELARVPGTKLLPLMKLMLLEESQRQQEAAPTAGNGAQPGATQAGPAGAAGAKPQPINLDDLLGIDSPSDQAPEGSQRSGSPSPPGSHDDPFAALAEGRAPSAQGMKTPQGHGSQVHRLAPESLHSQFSAMSVSTGPPGMYAPRPSSPAVSIASHTTYASALPSVAHSAPSPPAGHGGHFISYGSAGAGPGYGNLGYAAAGGPYQQGAPFPPSPYASAPGAAQLARQGSGGAAAYDASSPYFVQGKPSPYGEDTFRELAPALQPQRPAPPPPAGAGATMRTEFK